MHHIAKNLDGRAEEKIHGFFKKLKQQKQKTESPTLVPPLSTENTFQNPKTMGSTEPYTDYVFSYPYTLYL